MSDVDRASCPAGVHGDLYAYRRHGCRCPEARRARGEDAARARRAHGVRVAPPTVRAGRYVALLRHLLEAHTGVDLADRLGWSPSRLSALLRARRLQRPTAERIAELHALLTGGPPAPVCRAAPIPHRVRWRAVDDGLVAIAAGGGVPWEELPAAPRVTVVEALRVEGLSAVVSGERLRVSARTVQRWRARAAQAA